MKFKVSLVLILLSIFFLHKIDKKHLIFSIHPTVGCHSYIENRANTDNQHHLSNSVYTIKQGAAHKTRSLIQGYEKAEVEKETSIQIFDITHQIFKNYYSTLKYKTSLISSCFGNVIINLKIYVLNSVFRI